MPFWFNQFSRYLYFGLIFTYFCSPSHDSNNNGFAFATISSSFYGNLDITLFKEILNLLRHMWTWPHVYHLISYYSPKQTAQAFLFLCLFLSAPLLHIHIYLCPSSLPGKPSLLLICPSRSFSKSFRHTQHQFPYLEKLGYNSQPHRARTNSTDGHRVGCGRFFLQRTR